MTCRISACGSWDGLLGFSLDNPIAFQIWLLSWLQFKLEKPVASAHVADVEVSSESRNVKCTWNVWRNSDSARFDSSDCVHYLLVKAVWATIPNVTTCKNRYE